MDEAKMLSIQADAIVAEGTKLYRCEQASWYATDIFSEQYPEKSDAVAGYLSYADGSAMKTIFFSSGINPLVAATITFDSTLNPRTADINKTEREPTRLETELYIMQQQALTDIKTHNDFFRAYKSTNFNLIPLIDSTDRRVYVTTGLKQSCLVIFGNDYLLNFDSSNKVVFRRQFHKNIIPVECSRNITDNGNRVPGTMHLHTSEDEDLITATDVCTLMLYQKLANWTQHTVFSKSKVSVWKCETNQLLVMTKEDWSNMFNGAGSGKAPQDN